MGSVVQLPRDAFFRPGRYCYEIWPKRSEPCPDCPIVEAMETGQPQEAEKTTPDRKSWLIRGYPVRDDSGDVVGAVEVTLEITERERAEAALRESEEKYRQLFELEADAIFLIDNETGQILEVNAVALALYDYSREEMLQKKNTDLSAQPDETRRATVEGWTRVPVRFHRKKDGSVFPVEITGRHFTWQGREVHIAAIRDITERLQAEE